MGQVRADVYEKVDKELLEYVEDVLLNRCENATERMLEYAALLDPKSPPTKLRKIGGEPAGPTYTPKLNPIPTSINPVAVEHLPAVPEYKQWHDPLRKSDAFDQLEKIFQERIAYIDGGMGTMIQRYKLKVPAGAFPLASPLGHGVPTRITPPVSSGTVLPLMAPRSWALHMWAV